MVQKIIGLVGRARSGKDTVANFFRATHNVRRFAQPMKDATKALYGWSDSDIETDLKDIPDLYWGLTPRTAMIHMAESTKKLVSPDFFVKRLFGDWTGDPIVIADVRYQNEVREIHERGGITIKIKRTNGTNYEFEDQIEGLQTTYEVKNDGTLHDLRIEIERLGIV
jgi:hypothetical protein